MVNIRLLTHQALTPNPPAPLAPNSPDATSYLLKPPGLYGPAWWAWIGNLIQTSAKLLKELRDQGYFRGRAEQEVHLDRFLRFANWMSVISPMGTFFILLFGNVLYLKTGPVPELIKMITACIMGGEGLTAYGAVRNLFCDPANTPRDIVWLGRVLPNPLYVVALIALGITLTKKTNASHADIATGTFCIIYGALLVLKTIFQAWLALGDRPTQEPRDSRTWHAWAAETLPWFRASAPNQQGAQEVPLTQDPETPASPSPRVSGLSRQDNRSETGTSGPPLTGLPSATGQGASPQVRGQSQNSAASAQQSQIEVPRIERQSVPQQGPTRTRSEPQIHRQGSDRQQLVPRAHSARRADPTLDRTASQRPGEMANTNQARSSGQMRNQGAPARSQPLHPMPGQTGAESSQSGPIVAHDSSLENDANLPPGRGEKGWWEAMDLIKQTDFAISAVGVLIELGIAASASGRSE